VRDTVEHSRAQRPEQRGWVCHESFHYNTPDSTLTPDATCQCNHTACRPAPTTHVQSPMGSGRIISPSASTSAAQLPATCFDVQVTTREDPRCNGWVCFFCKVYVAALAPNQNGNAPPICGNCGLLEDSEVFFVKKVSVAPPNNGQRLIKVERLLQERERRKDNPNSGKGPIKGEVKE
jgi:hypothetical protein